VEAQEEAQQEALEVAQGFLVPSQPLELLQVLQVRDILACLAQEVVPGVGQGAWEA